MSDTTTTHPSTGDRYGARIPIDPAAPAEAEALARQHFELTAQQLRWPADSAPKITCTAEYVEWSYAPLPADGVGEDTPRDHWTEIGGQQPYRYRHTWTVADALQQLPAAFLAHRENPGIPGGDMRIVDDNGDALAVMVSPQRLRDLEAAAAEFHALVDSGRKPDAGYQPFLCSPLADLNGNRMIPSEQFEDPFARVLAGQLGLDSPDQLNGKQRDAVRVAAIIAACHLRLDADTHDVVPVLCVGPGDDSAEQDFRWVLAYTTPVPGLYVRQTGNGFFGPTYGLVAGSGWALQNGWVTREAATAAAVDIGAVLPGLDWDMVTRSNALDPEQRTAVLDAMRRHYPYGAQDTTPAEQPTPQPADA